MWFRQYVLEIGTAPSKDKYLLLRRTLHILFIINHDFTEGRKFLMPLAVMHSYTTVEASIELCADDWIDTAPMVFQKL